MYLHVSSVPLVLIAVAHFAAPAVASPAHIFAIQEGAVDSFFGWGESDENSPPTRSPTRATSVPTRSPAHAPTAQVPTLAPALPRTSVPTLPLTRSPTRSLAHATRSPTRFPTSATSSRRGRTVVLTVQKISRAAFDEKVDCPGLASPVLPHSDRHIASPRRLAARRS